MLIQILLALALWPLIVQSLIITLWVITTITYVPAIFARYRWGTWLWLALGITLLLEAVGTILVMQSPGSNFPQSLSITPVTTAGLLISAWALLGWVLATELTARIERQRQEQLLDEGEDLDTHLRAFAA